jgi:2-methylcitrate dehydratase
MPATLIGTSIKTSPEWAAFVNSCMIRYLDFNDDYLRNDGPHPSDTIGGVLAIAEANHADGKALACGITLAYELDCNLVDTAQFCFRGWDYTTETTLGVALGAAKILGCNKEQMANAIALAIAPNISLWQTRQGGLSMWKGCAGPNGSRNGAFAALLASEGMTGPDEIFEGVNGLWNQVTGKFKLDPFGGGGRPFKIEGTYFKYRPVMYTVLLPIETAITIRDKIDLDNIESIKLFLDDFSLKSPKPDAAKWDPQTRESADHSIPYLTGAVLVDGEITEKTYTPERYRDPYILSIVKKITIEEDPQYSKEWPDTFNCRIEVTDKQGKKVIQHNINPKGHPANPMSDAEIEEKFLRLVERTLTPKQARNALDIMWNLEKVKDVSQILESVLV